MFEVIPPNRRGPIRNANPLPTLLWAVPGHLYDERRSFGRFAGFPRTHAERSVETFHRPNTVRVRSNQFPALHPRRDRPALPPPNANPSFRSADCVPMTLIPCVKSKNDDQHNHQRPVVDLR